jgi:hypothetical protein
MRTFPGALTRPPSLTAEETGRVGGRLRVTAVPAQHGPNGCEPSTGPVPGSSSPGDGLATLSVSGATPHRTSSGWWPAAFRRSTWRAVRGATRTALLDGAHLTPTSEQANARLGPPVTIPACAFPAPA